MPLILAAALLGVSVFAVFGMDNELFPDADGGNAYRYRAYRQGGDRPLQFRKAHRRALSYL